MAFNYPGMLVCMCVCVLNKAICLWPKFNSLKMKVSLPKKELAKRGLLISKCYTHTHTNTLIHTHYYILAHTHAERIPCSAGCPSLVMEIPRLVSSRLALPSDSFARLATCDAFLRQFVIGDSSTPDHYAGCLCRCLM